VILEKITAALYALFGKATFVIPRMLISLLWVVGGIPLFLITRRFSGTNGALFALAFYELLPFGVIAGRSFQPDPFMVTVILFAVLFQIRWSEDRSLKNALLAGGFSGTGFC
jgi:4-amino-4-deoxy-L-arabinose transferase-like glycosyltransferase